MLGRVPTSSSSESSGAAFDVALHEPEPGICLISVTGELDLSTAPRLKWMLLDAIEAGQRQLIVDLSPSTFIDSTALGVLVGVKRRLAGELHSGLAIVCARESLLKIFEVSGMDGAFAIFPRLEEALGYTRGPAARTG